jgi:prolipoprotein diacylglyceryl transferase
MLASIPSPPTDGLHIGPLFVHAYGLAYVVGVIAAVAITSRRWERQGGTRELVHEVALWGFPAGLVGGRLYFLATSWNEVPDHWWGPLAIWEGGLGIWGGIALGTLAGLLVLRRRGADIPRFMDAAAPGLLVAQAIGRIGNYFNQELFGGPTTLPWGLHIDVAHRPAGYAQYATFHPTFLYELVWNLVLAGALVWLGRRRRIRAPGLFALYVAGYSGFRIFEELLRVDPAHHILGLRLNFFVALALTAASLTWFARLQWGTSSLRRLATRRGPAALGLAWVLCALSGCGQEDSARSAFVPQSSPAQAVVSALRPAPCGRTKAQSVSSRMTASLRAPSTAHPPDRLRAAVMIATVSPRHARQRQLGSGAGPGLHRPSGDGWRGRARPRTPSLTPDRRQTVHVASRGAVVVAPHAARYRVGSPWPTTSSSLTASASCSPTRTA